MDSRFEIPKDFNIPKNIQELKSDYYLTKIRNGSEEQISILRKTSMPSFVRNSFMSISNLFSPHQYVYDDKLINLMKIAANPEETHLSKEYVEIYKDVDLEALARNSDFQDLARVVPGIETLNTKLRRGLRKTAKVAEGLEEMGSKGIQGKALSSSYLIEAGTEEHLYDMHTYLDEWIKSSTHLNFDDWIKWNHPKIKLQKVKYLINDLERLPYKLDIIDGKVLRTNAPFNTALEHTEHSGEGKAIFVVDAKGQFYAGSHERGKFHHSSFLGGMAVRGAGEIETNEEGKIISLSNKSGHYKPTKEQILNTLRILESSQVDLSKIKFIELGANGTLIYNSAKEYLDSEGKCAFNGYEGFGVEFHPNGDCVLSLEDQTLSLQDRLEQMDEAGKFLKAKSPNASFKYKEKLPSGHNVEYSVDDYMFKKAKLAPINWEGGKLEFEDGKLKKIIGNENNTIEESAHFLNLLIMSNIDLNSLEFENAGQIFNAEQYFNQLIGFIAQKSINL